MGILLLVIYFKMARNKNQKAIDVAKKLQRKIAIQQGYYDGRYREKIIPDKKKEAKRKWARKNEKAED